MKVAVGSKNPVKIAAVKEAFESFFSQTVDVVGVAVKSGVPDQPTDSETWQGALNRALNAFKAVEAVDYAVGIEAGIFRAFGRYFVANSVVIICKDGLRAFGMSPWFEIPEWVAKSSTAMGELERVVERIYRRENIGEKEGLIGILTRGLMPRKELTKAGVIAALAGLKAMELKDEGSMV